MQLTANSKGAAEWTFPSSDGYGLLIFKHCSSFMEQDECIWLLEVLATGELFVSRGDSVSIQPGYAVHLMAVSVRRAALCALASSLGEWLHFEAHGECPSDLFVPLSSQASFSVSMDVAGPDAIRPRKPRCCFLYHKGPLKVELSATGDPSCLRVMQDGLSAALGAAPA